MTGSEWDELWIDVHLATMAPGGAPYGRTDDGALAVKGGRIAWVGRRGELEAAPEKLAAAVHEGGGGWLTPGLIDCHSHIVHGGNRAREFETRLQGATYEEVARAGGGILSTVRATREAGEDNLFASARRRIEGLLGEGVTTMEIKSGYGLTVEGEMKMLRVARRLGRELPLFVVTTLLGAHALPDEFDGRPDDYIALVVGEMVPEAARAGLADAVDAYCEGIAFTPAQVETVFRAARAHGLPVKLHAEQFSDLGGGALAARYGALSADHLEYLGKDGVRAMADAGTVAVLLPGAFYFLRESQLPPVDLLQRNGIPIAIATDCNPGSSPTVSLLLMMNMACTIFRMTPEAALAGVTRNAAKALGLNHTVGTLEAGKAADLALWDVQHPAELAYAIGANPCRRVVKAATN